MLPIILNIIITSLNYKETLLNLTCYAIPLLTTKSHRHADFNIVAIISCSGGYDVKMMCPKAKFLLQTILQT